MGGPVPPQVVVIEFSSFFVETAYICPFKHRLLINGAKKFFLGNFLAKCL